MRLLCTQKPGLEFEEFYGEGIPKYAILSHTWYSNNKEVSYQDVCDGKGHDRLGYEKILKCKALASDYEYFWVDTCCIDKTSSAELSEAINSMYLWYARAAVCYAYLSDVSATDSTETFQKSRWFTRGWTLQELVAPAKVIFYSKEWERLSEKGEILELINDVTAIPQRVLSGDAKFTEFSVAQRMSWAANRTTTRIEDEAYSLIGLFNVNMPLLYGEREKAFFRLQEEIIKTTDDQSLFAWVDPLLGGVQYTGLLAKRPKFFAGSQNIHSMGIWGKGNVVGVTNRGIRIKLFLIPYRSNHTFYLSASLDCWTNSHKEETVAISLRRLETDGAGLDSAHETQFCRMHGPSQRVIVLEDRKFKGEYKEIYVTDVNLKQELNLTAYDCYGKYVCIRHLGHPFSVYPVYSWEPQTAIFTAPHMHSGTLGAICVSINNLVYITYFGRDTSELFWVKIEPTTSGKYFKDNDFWQSYNVNGEESDQSELVYRAPGGSNSHLERIAAQVKSTLVYDVRIYEITIVVDRAES